MSAENISKNGGPEPKVNFNTAPEEELVVVPGIGPAMARRIIAERPFEEVAELERVSGIGPNLLERMKPYLTLDNQSPDEETYEVVAAAEPVLEELVEAEIDEVFEEEAIEEPELPVAEDIVEMAEEVVEPSEEEAVDETDLDLEPIFEEEEEIVPTEVLEPEPFEEVEPVVAPAPEPVAAAPKTLTRTQAFWLAFGTGLLSFILALLVSLGVLAAINNNQLRFATPGQVSALDSRVDGLLGQAEALQGDLEGLRARVDGLEPLGGRVEAVEATTTQLESGMAGLEADMANTSAEVQELRGQTEIVAEQVQVLEGQTSRFESFFTGLQDLMSEIFAAEEAP